MVNTGFSEITEERLYYKGAAPWYCEIAITGKCNFSCKYCNRFNAEIDLPLLREFLFSVPPLRHIQITGGEPTVHPDFGRIMRECRKNTAVLGLSTNGTAETDTYLASGADMFSISLDDNDLGVLYERGYRNPKLVIGNIKELSKSRYVNIGLVVDRLNVDRIEEIIDFILELGADDIKLSISTKDEVLPIFKKSYSDYPILNYRVERFKKGFPMRGGPVSRCGIAVNDITIVGDKHYPCLVYFREGGKAIGTVGKWMMAERKVWAERHDATKDRICSKYCMDFKCEFNRALLTIDS